jgi:hypothetical protein
MPDVGCTVRRATDVVDRVAGRPWDPQAALSGSNAWDRTSPVLDAWIATQRAVTQP